MKKENFLRKIRPFSKNPFFKTKIAAIHAAFVSRLVILSKRSASKDPVNS